MGLMPHVYFRWTEGNPVTNLLRFLAFGEGEIAPVTREVLREAEPDVTGARGSTSADRAPPRQTPLRGILARGVCGVGGKHAGGLAGADDPEYLERADVLTCGPFGPWVTSNSTFWFSSRER